VAAWRVALLVATLLPACAPATFRAPPGVPQPAEQHRGAHFVIDCHFPCGDAGQGALETAESAWSVAAELLDAQERVPDRPLEIHLYDRPEDYEAVDRQLTGGRFRLNRAVTHPGTASAHILAHPFVHPDITARFGLTANTRRTIAHEAFHLAARTLSPETRRLRPWVNEGMATWAEIEVLVRLGLARSVEEEPVSGTRAYLLRARVEEGTLPPLSELLAGVDSLPLADRYAVHQYLFDFLRTTRHARVSAALKGLNHRPADAFENSLFGPERADTLALLDRELRDWIRDLPSGWAETRRALAVLPGDTWYQVGFDGGGVAWRWQPLVSVPGEIRGTVEPLGPQVPEASVLLALLNGGYLSITFTSRGDVTVRRHGGANDERPPPLLSRAAQRPLSGPVSFRVRFQEDLIGIRVEDFDEIMIRNPSLRATGRWGLAVPPAGNAVWRLTEPGS
jgi:hypothetical protein